MINDPTKWPNQMWAIPSDDVRLERENEQWYIVPFLGVRIPIEASYGEKLAELLITHYIKYAFDGDDPRVQ